MTIKITTPNGGSDSLDFGCAQTPVVATVTGTEVSSGEGKLEFKTTTGSTSATKATVLANGNVGIGTTSPDAKLDIFGATENQIRITDDAAYYYAIGRSSTQGYLNFYGSQSAATGYIFGGAAGERMRITSAGNVGIGTTSPAVPLQIGSAGGVAHNGYSKLSLENGDHCVMAMRSPNNKLCQIIFDDTDATGRGQITYNHNEDSMAFATAATERMRIDNAGNLKFNSGYGSAATAYGCRAWVNFNGTGTVAIRDSGNVSSITDNGTGNYTVNFAVAMVDVNYAVMGLASSTMTGRTADVSPYFSGTYTAAATQFLVKDSADVTIDTVHVSIAILR